MLRTAGASFILHPSSFILHPSSLILGKLNCRSSNTSTGDAHERSQADGTQPDVEKAAHQAIAQEAPGPGCQEGGEGQEGQVALARSSGRFSLSPFDFRLST